MVFELLVYPKHHAGSWNLNSEKDKTQWEKYNVKTNKKRAYVWQNPVLF